MSDSDDTDRYSDEDNQRSRSFSDPQKRHKPQTYKKTKTAETQTDQRTRMQSAETQTDQQTRMQSDNTITSNDEPQPDIEYKKKNTDRDYKKSKASLKTKVKKKKVTMNIVQSFEKNLSMYFVKLVAGEIGKETEELLNTDSEMLDRDGVKYISNSDFSNELLTAWEKVMCKVIKLTMTEDTTDLSERFDLFQEYIKYPDFLQIMAEYCGYLISSKGSELMLDYKSKYMLEYQRTKLGDYDYLLTKILQNLNKLTPDMSEKFNRYENSR